MSEGERPEAEEIDVRATFAASFEIYKENFGKILLLVLILVVPFRLVIAASGTNVVSLIFDPISTVADILFAVTLVRLVQAIEMGGPELPGALALIRSGWPRLFWLCLLYVVTTFLIVCGSFLLIVPGVILGLMWLVAFPVMAIERLGVFDSMSRSSDLTRGHRMNILWIGVVFVLVFAVAFGLNNVLPKGGFSVGAGVALLTDLIINPLVYITTTVLYYGLLALKGGEPYRL